MISFLSIDNNNQMCKNIHMSNKRRDSMYKIVTDSCCDLPYEIIKRENIDFIPLEVIMNDEIFFDDFGQTIDTNDFYKKLKEGVVPTTSQINVSRYSDFFRQYAEKNIPVLYICFSSGMSGSYQSALLAVEIIKKEFPNAEIYIMDSLSASGGQGMVVLDALNNLKANMTFDENILWLEKHKMNYNHWVLVDDLEHLYRGGRLSKSTARIGELLNVKPILVINKEGKLAVHSKVRTKKRAVSSIADKVVDAINTSPDSNKQVVIITNSGDLATAELLRDIILDQAIPKEILICDLGATIASHTGYGCVAAFVTGPERSK